MASDRQAARGDLSRRDMLSASAAVPLGLAASAAGAAEPAPAQSAAAVAPMGGAAHPPALAALETLTNIEMEALEAVCSRLIPTDDLGPGAKEARAANYIDRSLAGPLMKQRAAYAAGLSALDAFARSAKGNRFAELTPADQDAVLSEMEAGRASGFASGSTVFFTLLRTHTIEGMFADPFYGGNQGFIGWDLIAYPGLRMHVEAGDQRMVKPAPLRESAYSASMFGRGGV